MVVLLFTAIAVIGLLALSLYFWVPRLKDSGEPLLPPPEPRGFLDDSSAADLLLETSSVEAETARAPLNERAEAGDKTVLNEAHELGDQKFYSELLDQLTGNADRQPELIALVSYVTRHELPVNHKLAEAFIKSWESSPTRSSTATSLHL